MKWGGRSRLGADGPRLFLPPVFFPCAPPLGSVEVGLRERGERRDRYAVRVLRGAGSDKGFFALTVSRLAVLRGPQQVSLQ